ncbi:MAG: hypothetical protein WA126_14965 [Thermodesulfovibrionales bacterium]
MNNLRRLFINRISGGAVHARLSLWRVHAAAFPDDHYYFNLEELRDCKQKALRHPYEKASPHCLTREAINT